MTDTFAKHRATPTTEDHRYHSIVHEAEFDRDELELYSRQEHIPDGLQSRWTYFLLGCTSLLPWSAMTNATSFFLSRVAGSPIYPTFVSYWSTLYMLTKLVSQFYCTFTSKQSSPSRRIFTSISAMVFLVISLCSSTFVRGTPPTFFAFALLVAASMAAAVGCLCTAVYAQAALLGAPYLRAVLSGQAAITVVISIVQVSSSIVALSWGSAPNPNSTRASGTGKDVEAEEAAARIFFGVSAAFLCITLVVYARFTRQRFHNSVTNTPEQDRIVGVPDELTPLFTDDRNNSSTVLDSHIYQVLRQNSILMFSLAYVFVVTLAIFPAITARVQPMEPSFHPMLFVGVHFLVFNTGDLLGRYSCSFPRLVFWSGETILTMSLLRTLFVPLILFCNVDRPEATPILPVVHSDLLFMIIMLAIGYTNGYVSTLAFITVSSLEHNPGLNGCREDVDVAATLAGSSIIVGLTIGSLSSFGVQALI